MKATVALALLLLTFVAQADVVFEDTPSRPPRKKPVKPHTTVTAKTTTAATTTAATTAATTTTTTAATATTASSVTETTASRTPVVPAPAPERRRSTFPFAALTTVGIALVAITARRRRARKSE